MIFLIVTDFHDQRDLIAPLEATVTRIRPDAVFCLGDLTEHVRPAVAYTEAFLSVSQGVLRTVLARWAAPEFMSGDGSNGNFSSSLVAGGPFVRAVEARQLEVAGFVRRVAEIVLRLCVESGRLSADQVRAVKVDVVPPSVVIVDKGAAKTLSSTTLRSGVYAFIFAQKGLMGGIGLQGSKITKITPSA